MATFNTDCTLIRPGGQRVYVSKSSASNWTLDLSLWCTTVQLGTGMSGSSANFTQPEARWHSGDDYVGAEVLVYASPAGTQDFGDDPVFHGWITGVSGALTESSDGVTFQAVSAVRMLNKVMCGAGHWSERYLDYITGTIKSRQRIGAWPRYPRWSQPNTKTGARIILWQPVDILRDIFNGLPSYWGAAIGLGNTSVLNKLPDQYSSSGFDAWEFTAVSVADAMETVIASYGDVTFRENFQGRTVPRVKLDFYRVNDGSSTRKWVTVPELCHDAHAFGYSVSNIDRSDERADVVDRVVLAGQPAQIVITASSWDGRPGAGLRPYWNVMDVTRQVPVGDPGEDGAPAPTVMHTLTNEEWVLADPEHGKRGSEIFIPECEWCYKRFKLPSCVSGMRILDKITLPDPVEKVREENTMVFMSKLDFDVRPNIGVEYMKGYQAMMGRLVEGYGYTCGGEYGGGEYGYGYGYMSTRGWTLVAQGEVELRGSLKDFDIPVSGGTRKVPQVESVSGFSLEKNVLTLSEPALVNMLQYHCAGEDVIIRGEAEVLITFAIEYPARILADTGQPDAGSGDVSSGMALIGHDGMYLAESNDAWRYIQLTNMGAGWQRPGHGNQTFPLYGTDGITEIAYEWVLYTVPQKKNSSNNIELFEYSSGQLQVQNDVPAVDALAGRLLASKRRPRRSYRVTLPGMTGTYKVGDGITVRNHPGFEWWDDFSVTGIEYDLAQLNTSLTIDNEKPEEEIEL